MWGEGRAAAAEAVSNGAYDAAHVGVVACHGGFDEGRVHNCLAHRVRQLGRRSAADGRPDDMPARLELELDLAPPTVARMTCLRG